MTSGTHMSTFLHFLLIVSFSSLLVNSTLGPWPYAALIPTQPTARTSYPRRWLGSLPPSPLVVHQHSLLLPRQCSPHLPLSRTPLLSRPLGPSCSQPATDTRTPVFFLADMPTPVSPHYAHPT